MGYSGSLLHVWHFQGKWKDHLVLETQRRYFEVLIIRVRMESCQIFSITSCSQTKIAWFDVNGSVEDENVSRNRTRSLWTSHEHRNRYECTGKWTRCKIHEENCQSKSEKDNILMSKEQCQPWDKCIRRAHSTRICNSCLQ